MHVNTQKPYAMKILDKESLKKTKQGKDLTALDLVYKEINILKELKHPNVVKLFEVIDDENEEKLYLIMEYMSEGIAFDSNEKKLYSEVEAKKYFLDMLLGMEYSIYFFNIFLKVHYMKVIHMDIKPENLLKNDSEGFFFYKKKFKKKKGILKK
jgi:serine/threonine protein kinase